MFRRLHTLLPLPLPLLLLSAVVATSGCSYVREYTGLLPERDREYREAKELPDLEVPEGMDATRIDPLLPIPAAGAGGVPSDFEVPRPSTLLTRDPGDPVKIQKLGERRWLLIADSPQSVWPRLKQFLLDNGVRVIEEQPREGLMVTDWLQVTAAGHRDAVRAALSATAGAGQHRLLFRVEQGVRDGTTEIHLRQQQGFVVVADNSFPEASKNAAAEQDLLSEVGGYLAAIAAQPNAETAVSMLARNISEAPKATVEQVAGQPALRLNLDFGRAWATVGQALANAEVEVTDLNRDTAVFYVTLTNEALERDGEGFFVRLIPFVGGDEGVPLQIHLQPAPGANVAYDVLVKGAAAEPVAPDLGNQVLALIREFAG